jgi:hypothetical protein
VAKVLDDSGLLDMQHPYPGLAQARGRQLVDHPMADDAPRCG